MGSSSTRVLEQFSNEPNIRAVLNLKRERKRILFKARNNNNSRFLNPLRILFLSSFHFSSNLGKKILEDYHHSVVSSDSRTRDPLNPIAGWQTPGERFNRFNHRIVDTLIDRSFTRIESRSNKRATTGQRKRKREGFRAIFEGRRKENLFEHSGCSRCRPLQTTSFLHKAPPRSHSSNLFGFPFTFVSSFRST